MHHLSVGAVMLLLLQVAAGLKQLGNVSENIARLHILNDDGDKAYVHYVKRSYKLRWGRGEEVLLVVGGVGRSEVLRGKLR